MVSDYVFVLWHYSSCTLRCAVHPQGFSSLLYVCGMINFEKKKIKNYINILFLVVLCTTSNVKKKSLFCFQCGIQMFW